MAIAACEAGEIARPAPVPTGLPPAAWYHLYFTGPTPDRLEGGIPEAIATSLDTAHKTIDVAIYELDLPSIASALTRAQTRGVRLRLVTDSDSLEMPFIQDLLKAKVPVVADGRQAFMHDKFIVIDELTVWTGSMNFTENDAYRNNNNYIEITSSQLAENYTREFEEMFVRRQFGPSSTADTPHPVVTASGGTRIENYFAPEDGVAAHILRVLRSARTSIRFMAFSFTRDDFAQILIEKARAGVSVQGVFERRQIQAGSSAWDELKGAGLDVRLDGNRYNQHSKVFVVDSETVVTGSYNFTQSADKQNDENVLIIHDAAIARAYEVEWEKVWMTAGR